VRVQQVPFGVTNGVPAFQRTMNAIVDSEKLTGTFPYLGNVTAGGRTQSEHDTNVQRQLDALKKRQITLNDSYLVGN